MARKAKITKEQLVAELESGLCQADIARKYDVSPNTIRQYIIRWKIREYSPRRLKQIQSMALDKKEIERLFNEGYSRKEIAEKMGTTSTTVCKIIRMNGIDPNQRRRGITEERAAVDLSKVKFAEPPKKPFRDVVQGQRVLDVSCLFGL